MKRWHGADANDERWRVRDHFIAWTIKASWRVQMPREACE
jgi:hypothetical protein